MAWGEQARVRPGDVLEFLYRPVVTRPDRGAGFGSGRFTSPSIPWLSLSPPPLALSPPLTAPLFPPPPSCPPTYQALDRLMDLEADLSGFGADTDADRGHLRLAAAKALLRYVWISVDRGA